MKGGWLYIVTNRPNGTLYVGVTADLERRVAQHHDGMGSGFTSKYRLTRLEGEAHPVDQLGLGRSDAVTQ